MRSILWPFARFARSARVVGCRVMRSLLTTSTAVVLSACGSSDGPSGAPGSGQSTTRANLSPVSTTSYFAPAGTRVATELVVSARNSFNLVAVGVPLTATASAGGIVSPASATTDATGEARFQWTLGRVEGDQTLTVSPSGGGQPATFTATATRPAVASVSVTPAPLPPVVENDTLRVSASASDALAVGLPNRTFTWSTSNAAVLSVTPSGATGATALLRALAPGTAQVTVASEGRSVMFGLTVTAGTVASVTITPPTRTVVAAQTVTLSAAARDARGGGLTGRAIRWRSATPTVATIDSVTGVATGVTGGTTLITAMSESVTSTAVTLTVTDAPVATVTITPPAPVVQAGQTVQLTAVLRDAAGTPLAGRVIAWASSKSAVATVTGTGLVSGVSPDTATITATSEGRTGSVTLRVHPTFACGGAPALGCGFGAEQFVAIPPTVTPFFMGSNYVPAYPNEQPVHAVSITRPFVMQRTEVTQGQWRAVMAGTALSDPSRFTACGDLCPVEQVSWDDIQLFIARLNAVTPGGTYRLPTEAEWEYAARAGTTTETYGPIDAIAWYSGNNSPDGTKPVATRTPNGFELYDMLGNVSEWVNDRHGAYPMGAVTDPTGPTTGLSRVLRGGSWGYGGFEVRAAYRLSLPPSVRGTNGSFGFRLVRTP